MTDRKPHFHIPVYPASEPRSTDFAAAVCGETLPVLTARVSAVPFNTWWPGHQRPLDQTEIASFAAFSMTEGAPVTLTVRSFRRIDSLEVRPASCGVKPRIEGNTVTLTVEKPCFFTLEVNGFARALHVFVSPEKDYGVDIHDPSVRYFGPGVHRAGLIRLYSGETLYLDEGAIVYGTVYAHNADGIRVLGRGILDASPYKRLQEYENDHSEGEAVIDALRACGDPGGAGNVLMRHCKNVVIDGPVFRDPPEWSYNIYDCENVVIRDVKLIGLWRYNADGIDIYVCKNVEIADSFIRSFDDSIIARGRNAVRDPDVFEDFNVHDCVLWCDWGRALEVWTGGGTAHMCGITFRNIEIIRTAHIAIDVQIYGSGTTAIRDFVCENVTAYGDEHALRPVYQKTDAQVYVNTDTAYTPQFVFIGNAYVFEKPFNAQGRPVSVRYEDFTFKNIRFVGPHLPLSIIKTVPGFLTVENVVFDGITVCGKAAENAEEMNLVAPSDAKIRFINQT